MVIKVQMIEDGHKSLRFSRREKINSTADLPQTCCGLVGCLFFLFVFLFFFFKRPINTVKRHQLRKMSSYVEIKEKSKRIGLKATQKLLVFPIVFKVASSFKWEKNGLKWQKCFNTSTYFYKC